MQIAQKAVDIKTAMFKTDPDPQRFCPHVSMTLSDEESVYRKISYPHIISNIKSIFFFIDLIRTQNIVTTSLTRETCTYWIKWLPITLVDGICAYMNREKEWGGPGLQAGWEPLFQIFWKHLQDTYVVSID